MGESRYNIGELAAMAKVSRRTVRFYVTLGLISSPLGRGPGHHYTDNHLQEILTIRALQGRGVSLAEMQDQKVREAPLLLPTEPPTPDLHPQLITRILLQPGVSLEFLHEACELTPADMEAIAERCREAIKGTKRR